MQKTIQEYSLNRTSSQDRWMLDDNSYIYLGNDRHSQLKSHDWNSRFIFASALYLNAIEFINEDYANLIIRATINQGNEYGQIALAPVLQELNGMDSDQVPSAISGRVIGYCGAIDWTVATPWSDSEEIPIRQKEEIPIKERVIILNYISKGEYSLGTELNENKTLTSISYELISYINNAYADVEFMYYSTSDKSMRAAKIAKRYIEQKWGYDFFIETDF